MADDLLIRAAIRDELTAPLQRIERELEGVSRATRKLNVESAASTRTLTKLATAKQQLAKAATSAHGTILRLSSGIGNTLTAAARTGGLALGALAGAAVVFGLKAASSFEQYRFAFGALLGDVTKGNALFAELQAFNKESPFELPQIAEATQTLLNYGFAGDKALAFTKSIADIASTSGPQAGENLNRIAVAIGQIQGAGVARAQDLNQLVQAGVPAYELLAQSIGKTVAETRNLMEAGSLPAGPFLDKLLNLEGPLENRRGASAKFAKTLAGQLSNLKDTVNMALGDALAPAIGSLTAIVKPLADVIGALLKVVGPPLSQIVQVLAQGLLRIIPLLTPALDAMLSVVTSLATQLGTALVPVLPELVDSFVEFTDALIPLLPSLVRLAILLVPVLARALDFGAALARVLTPALEPIARLLEGVSGEAGPLDEIMGILFVTLLGYRALSAVVGTLHAFAAGIAAINAASAGGGAATAGGTIAGAAGKAGGASLLARLGASAAPAAGALGRGALAFAGSGAAMAGGIAGLGYLVNKGENPNMQNPGEVEAARKAGLLLSPEEDEAIQRAMLANPRGQEAPWTAQRAGGAGGMTVNGPLVNVERADSSFDAAAQARRAKSEADRRARERNLGTLRPGAQ